MKHLILGLLAILTISCVSKKDFEALQDKVNTLENTVVANNISTLALITEVTDNVATVIGQATTGIGATIQQAVDAQNEVNAALLAANQAHANSVAELVVLIAVNSDLAAILQTQIDDLESQIENLEDDLDDLDEIVDEIEESYIATEFTIWEPLFEVQVADFDQTRHPLLNGVQLDVTETRAINIGTTSETVTINAVEHDHNVDINNDLDQADSIRRTYTLYTHTGTISGTTTVVGTHQTSSTLSDWVVTDDN